MAESKPYTVIFMHDRDGPEHVGSSYEDWDNAANACRFLVEGGGAWAAWIASDDGDELEGAHHG